MNQECGSSPNVVHRSTLVIEIAPPRMPSESMLQLSPINRFRFDLLKRPKSYDWRQKSTTVTALQTEDDIAIGEEVLDGKVNDSMTISLGHLANEVQWCSYGENKSLILIHRRPLASDIVQGTLGNCWFLCALSLVAERPELLSCILKTTNEEFEEKKSVAIRLFRFGQWHLVHIDANLPCNANGHLIFSKAKRRQLFVPLIEKALAKLYGGYDKLIGGHLSEAMTSLTGFPCEILWLPPYCKLWSCEELNELLASDRYEVTIKAMLDELWIRIVSFHSAGFLLSASCGKAYLVNGKKQTRMKLESAEQYLKLGLLNNHAYSILNLKQIEPNEQRLVKLRNPWGTLTWNGKWADWTPPEEGKEKEKGTFWIAFDDLCRYFEQIIVGKVQLGWHHYAFKGFFPTSWREVKDWNVFELCLPSDEIIFDSPSYCQIMVTLYQRADKARRALFILLYELCDSVSSVTPILGPFRGASVCNVQNSVTVESELKRGKRYLLGVFGFNGTPQPEVDEERNDYVLRVYSSRAIEVKPYRCPNMALLGDMIINYTITAGDLSQSQSNVDIYQSPRSWAGVVAVIKNNHQKRWLSVTMSVDVEGKSTNKQWKEDESQPSSIIGTESDGHFKSLIINSGKIGDPLVRRSRRKTEEADKFDSHKLNNDDRMTKNEDQLQWQQRYMVSSRASFITKDIIPPEHCQLINLVTIREFMDKYILLTFNFDKATNQHKDVDGNRKPLESYHVPSILTTYGLHSPRIL